MHQSTRASTHLPRDGESAERRFRQFLGRINGITPQPALFVGLVEIVVGIGGLLSIVGFAILNHYSPRLPNGFFATFAVFPIATLVLYAIQRRALKAVIHDRVSRNRCPVTGQHTQASPTPPGSTRDPQNIPPTQPLTPANGVLQHVIQARLTNARLPDIAYVKQPDHIPGMPRDEHADPTRGPLVRLAWFIALVLIVSVGTTSNARTLLPWAMLAFAFTPYLLHWHHAANEYICLHRRISGRCWRCGYDLDASPHAIVCPECAEPVANSKADTRA